MTVTSPTVTISNPANTVVDVGQVFTVNGIISGGFGNYAVNAIVSNTLHGMIGNYLYTTAGTTWIATFTANSLMQTNSPVLANVVVTDSNSLVADSGYTTNIIVHTQLVASAAPAAAPSLVDSGQTSSLTIVAPTTGTPSYNYQWYSGPSATCSGDTTPVGTNSVSYTTAALTTATFYCVEETDGATTPNTVYTGTTEVTVTSPTVTISNPANTVVDVGQVFTVNGIISGGFGNYAVNAIVSNTLHGMIGNYLYTTAGTTWIATFTANSLMQTNSPVLANVVVTDSNSLVADSGYTTNIIVHTQLVASAAPAAAPSLVDSGQTSSLTIVAPTTGTPSYNYQWYSGPSATCSGDTTPVGTNSVSYTTAALTTATFYCVEETDGATTPNTVYTGTTEVTVTSPTVTISNPANTVVDVGQVFTVNGIISGGFGNYAVNAIVSNTLHGMIGNYLYTTAGTTWIATFTANSLMQTNSPVLANVVVTDSNSLVADSVYTTNIIVNTQLVASAAPTASNSVVTIGQPTLLTVAPPTTGSPGYSYVWFSGSNAACGSDASTGFTGSSHVFTSTVANTYYCVQEMDGATSPNTVYTGTTLITFTGVYVPPVVTISNPANTILDVGQVFTVNGVISNGVLPYSINVLVSNALLPSVIVSNDLFSTNGPAWIATFITVNSFASNSPVTVNVVLADSIPTTANSAYTANIVVNPALVGGVPSESANAVTNQNSVTLTALPSGGTPGYSYQWYYSYLPACSAGTLIPTATTNTYTTNLGNAYYCYALSDLATANNHVFSQAGLLAAALTNNSVVTVGLQANTPASIVFAAANSVVYINSTNTVTANVLVTNATSLYSTTPSASGFTFSEVVVLSLTATANTATVLTINLTMGYACGTIPAPYKLIGGTWTALSYTVNTIACTLDFNVPSDPIIGLFTSAAIQQGSGGSGGGGGAGGGGGGAISVLPTVKTTADSCTIINLAVGGSETCTFDNATFVVSQNYITETSSGTSVNGQGYTLTQQSNTVTIRNTPSYWYYLELLDINTSNFKVGAATVDLELYARSLHPSANTTTVTSVTTTSIQTTTSAMSTTITTTVPTTSTVVQQALPYGPNWQDIETAVLIIAAVAAAVIAWHYWHHRKRKWPLPVPVES